MLRNCCGVLVVAAGILVGGQALAAGVQGCPPGQRIRADLVQLNGTGINVRYGPGTDFDRIAAPDGSPFVADRTMQARPLCRVDDWVLAEVIVAGGQSRQAGWLLARFVDPSSAPAVAATTPESASADIRPVARRCRADAKAATALQVPQGDKVNVRSAPGTTAARVPAADGKEPLRLDADTRVHVLCTEEGWSFVRVAGAGSTLEGWVQADLLAPEPPPPPTSADAVQGCSLAGMPAPRIVEKDDVNVRVGPGRDFGRVVGRTGPVLLDMGQQVDLQCTEGDWARIALSDAPAAGGWVLAEYLQDPAAPASAETATAEPVPPPPSEPAVLPPETAATEPAALTDEPVTAAASPVPESVAAPEEEARAEVPAATEAPVSPDAAEVKTVAIEPADAEVQLAPAVAPATVTEQPVASGPCGPAGAPEPYLVGAMGSVLETILMVNCKDKPGPGWFVLESDWRKGQVTPSTGTEEIAEAVEMCEAKAQENTGKDARIDFWGEKDLWITVFPDHKMRVTKTFKVVSGKDAPVTRKISCLVARKKVVEQQTVMLQ